LTNNNVVAFNKIYDTGNPSDTDVYAAAIAIDDAQGTIALGNEIDTGVGASPNMGRGIHLAQSAPVTTISHNNVRNVRQGIGNDGGDHDRRGLVISQNIILSSGTGIVGGTTSASSQTNGLFSVTDNRITSSEASFAIIVDG